MSFEHDNIAIAVAKQKCTTIAPIKGNVDKYTLVLIATCFSNSCVLQSAEKRMVIDFNTYRKNEKEQQQQLLYQTQNECTI